MKKEIFIGLGIGIGLVLLIFLAFTSIDSPKTKAVLADQSPAQGAEKIQIYLFHVTKRCATCIAIGKLTGKTVTEYFQSEISDGKIEFREINVDLPENRQLAQKFQASGSALYINVIKDGKDNIQEDTTVWRLTSNETQFKNYLRDKINNLLEK